jgi:CubicO group peptidase (beta-lactamase class C family)
MGIPRHPRECDNPRGRRLTLRRALRSASALAAASVLLVCSACTAGYTPDPVANLHAHVVETVNALDDFGNVRAILVSKSGENMLELWRGDHAHDYLNVQSVTKSVISILIGIAIDQGAISGVSATLGELLPRYREAMSPEVAAITLDAILSDTAGFAPDDFTGSSIDFTGSTIDYASSPDWVGAIIADRVARGPGDGRFAYSGAGAHVLAAILDEATDGSVLDFARANLFEPLGIDSDPAWTKAREGTPEQLDRLAAEYFAAGFAWPTDPQGVQRGDSLLKLRPEDLLTLGLLYLHDGEWHGRQVVSKQWVQTSTTRQVDVVASNPNGYGYQWWVDETRGHPMFLALGYEGDIIAVVPDRELVAVVASAQNGHAPVDEARQFYIGDALALLTVAILPYVD